MRMLAWLVAVVAVVSTASAQEKSAHTLVAEANLAFTGGEYATALEIYRTAEVMRPEAPELAYNQGVASYMLGDFAQAHDAFNRALLTREVGLEAKAKFNLGNVAYARALEVMSNPPLAIELLESAIGHYRDAVELKPEDEDPRINIELAGRLIAELLDRLKEQRDQRRQQDDQQGQQEDDSDQQAGTQPGEQRQDGGEQHEATAQQAGDRMTRQEVEQLLQAVREKERERREELARRKHARRAPVEKDW